MMFMSIIDNLKIKLKRMSFLYYIFTFRLFMNLLIVNIFNNLPEFSLFSFSFDISRYFNLSALVLLFLVGVIDAVKY